MPRLHTLLVLCLLAGPAAAAPCGVDHGDFVQALVGTDLPRAAALLQAGRDDPRCDGTYLDGLEYSVHQLALIRADSLIDAKQYAAARALLDRYRPRGWNALALRGDLAMAEKDWAESARFYGRAYEVATLPPGGGSGPKPRAERDKLLKLYAKASDALALAGNLDTSIGRGGEPRGIFISRGPKPNLRPVPVQFVFGESEFTTAGKANAERLAAYLKHLRPKRLLLVGHTDPEGEAAYNLKLSRQRAERLKGFLQARGVEAPIRTIGRGESSPPQLVDPSRYTEKELYTLYRRVEFQTD